MYMILNRIKKKKLLEKLFPFKLSSFEFCEQKYWGVVMEELNLMCDDNNNN